MTIDELPADHPSNQDGIPGDTNPPQLEGLDGIPTGVPDIDDPVYGERAAIQTLLPGLRGHRRPLSPASATAGYPRDTNSGDTYDDGAIHRVAPPSDPDQILPYARIDDLLPQEPQERSSPAFTIDFLTDGDIDAARAVSRIINDPRNKKAFVSPYPSIEEDPKCEAIFREVRKPDKKVALFRDSAGNVKGHAQLSLHPDRADMVSWYLGVLDPDIQDQNVGPTFIQALTDATFEAEWPPDRAGNSRNIQLIEIHVILNDKNHPKDFSNVTRKQFPPAYRLMRKLSDFVDETAYYPPHIKTVLEDDSIVYLPVAVFTIRHENYAAFKSRKADGDID